MYPYNDPYYAFSGITPEEVTFLQQGTAGLDEQTKNRFYSIYSTKRRNPQDVLLVTLLGFVCVAGVQRFMLGQIGMGLLYIFTGGLCMIGTVVDLINHKNLTNEYNKQMAYETFQIVKMYQ